MESLNAGYNLGNNLPLFRLLSKIANIKYAYIKLQNLSSVLYGYET
jgi:hypothetical protein